MKNREANKLNRAHSWDLDENLIIERMRTAWEGRPVSPSSDNNVVKVEITPWLLQRERERARAENGGSVETITDDEKKMSPRGVWRDLPLEDGRLSELSCNTATTTASDDLGSRMEDPMKLLEPANFNNNIRTKPTCALHVPAAN